MHDLSGDCCCCMIWMIIYLLNRVIPTSRIFVSIFLLQTNIRLSSPSLESRPRAQARNIREGFWKVGTPKDLVASLGDDSGRRAVLLR
jgi:hypothetical protein